MTAAAISDLESRLDLLEEDRAAVVYALRREAEALRGEGTPNLLTVAEATEQFTREIAAVEQRLQETLLPSDASGAGRSLGDLREVLNRCRAALPGWELLADVRRLSGPLQSDDRRRIAAAADELEALLSRGLADGVAPTSLETLPLAALVRLVRGGAGLSDTEWERDQRCVGEAFGGAVSAAAARGRLSIKADESPTPE